MVAPAIVAAGIGAGGSIISGLIGAGAARQQASLQAALGQLQLNQAAKQFNASVAKQTNARGDQVIYDPTTNQWISILSPQGRALQSASDAEELQRLTVDAPLRREGLVANATRRREEGSLADALMRNVRDDQVSGGKYNAGALASSIRSDRKAAIDNAFDDDLNLVLRSAMRSGASNQDEMIRSSGRERAKSYLTMMGNPDLEGEQAAQSLNANNTGDLLNRYTTLASRAGAFDDGGFAPNQSASLADALMSKASGQSLYGMLGANSGLNAAANTFARAGTPPMLNNDILNGGTALMKAILAGMGGGNDQFSSNAGKKFWSDDYGSRTVGNNGAFGRN
jgi:hypothetical protein